MQCHWHHQELNVTRKSQLKNVLATLSHLSADCDPDDGLVCSNYDSHRSTLHNSKFANSPRMDTTRTYDLKLCTQIDDICIYVHVYIYMHVCISVFIKALFDNGGLS